MFNVNVIGLVILGLEDRVLVSRVFISMGFIFPLGVLNLLGHLIVIVYFE